MEIKGVKSDEDPDGIAKKIGDVVSLLLLRSRFPIMAVTRRRIPTCKTGEINTSVRFVRKYELHAFLGNVKKQSHK